ncbi:hypothetical protein L596_017500 [Steinernema carpocapsae]|uniref:Uncharacterized protein n=1 Tax=Steinernema carpocapsae TaxID=34508 RepID=A0A4U5N237_STECR|nr:hypothetical protein L596_017500 [Steinernema carpocapsae]
METAVRRLRLNGGIVERMKGSGRLKSVVTSAMGPRVEELLVSPLGTISAEIGRNFEIRNGTGSLAACVLRMSRSRHPRSRRPSEARSTV